MGRYDADFVVDMLRVHRSALVCGIVNVNPYFVPPKEYLAELKTARRRTGYEYRRAIAN